MADPDAQKLVWAGLLFAAMAALAALGAWIVSRFRGSADDDQPLASQVLSNFRELHEQGELSDEEFRNIKTLMSEKFQQELNVSGETGSDSSTQGTVPFGETDSTGSS